MTADAERLLLERLQSDPVLAARFRRALGDPEDVQALLDAIAIPVTWSSLSARIHQDHETMGEAELESVAGGVTFVGGVIDFFLKGFAEVLDIDVRDLAEEIGRFAGPL